MALSTLGDERLTRRMIDASGDDETVPYLI
jgi:hypothetical protein